MPSDATAKGCIGECTTLCILRRRSFFSFIVIGFSVFS